jgi:formylglycine-generating enzyme required for sulfatase activity
MSDQFSQAGTNLAQHAIFMGYRRDDTADAAGRMFDRLSAAFGEQAVFKDVDALPIGVDFGDHIVTVLSRCKIMLALIGPSWIASHDERGLRRLDDPKDWVRVELETALNNPNVQLIPVLMSGATMPRAEQLPESLVALTRLNAAELRRDPDFGKDMERIIRVLKASLERPSPNERAPASPVVPFPKKAFPEMVRISSGNFVMGSPRSEPGHRKTEAPQHRVNFYWPFAIGKYPVTFAEWDAALAAGAPLFNPQDDFGRGRRPVTGVSWEDAQRYIGFLNKESGLIGRSDCYRLPSEAEWEYACRSGTTSIWSFDNEEELPEYAWFEANSMGSSHPVGEKRPNAFGLFDMHGNVWEWCQDIWCGTYSNTPRDGSAQLEKVGSTAEDDIGRGVATRVFRGGHYGSVASATRSAHRNNRALQTHRDCGIGFRLARSLKPDRPVLRLAN